MNIMCLFVFSLSFFKCAVIKCRFVDPVARPPALKWQQFCAALVGGSSSCLQNMVYKCSSLQLLVPVDTEHRIMKCIISCFTKCRNILSDDSGIVFVCEFYVFTL